ncbi:HK97-gp10 family putative phage morphogenesis protein [Palleronia sp. LCG004]|uniref:HK97-gp10 family putative phage morphogenesis protein n=1 Tax=Palleronia sp. LCG004 TaxID=3079304 RepID=UPI00294279C0|nr:HK97-gp10 family putative phage morphogenesis protein [Palleronia sp. LCG004]WOI55128.1 HK97 gp10 family phage protein [Palleronia sp. LCG004]
MGKGLASFQNRMRAIPKAARDAVQPALAQGGYEVAETIESLAPEDTGDLVGSVTVTLGGFSTPPYSQPGGANLVPENQVAVTVGNSDVRYPHLVEYGTRHSAAQPFFWPGFRIAAPKAQRRIKRAILKAIREAR